MKKALIAVKNALKKAVDMIMRVLSAMVKIISVLLLAAIFLSCVIPLTIVAFTFVPELAVTVIALVILIYLISRLRLVLKRRKFIGELRAFCKSDGCTLTFFGKPMLNSLFRVTAGAKMEYEDHTSELYFVPCVQKGLRVILKADGSAVYLHRIAVKGTALFEWQHIWQFCDEPAKGSYVLLLPAPKRIYADRIHPSNEVDNATACGKYTVYTGGAFLRYMERLSAVRDDKTQQTK